MIEQHFSCTACGKCCYGRVSLTLDDAFANADRFPLAMVWTPVRQASRSFALTAQLGMTIKLRTQKYVAVLIAPTAYIPPSFPCPALTPENLCAIHAVKPHRCRTMPFFPYREEADQIDLLVPRKGWTCDTTDAAPVVYRNKKIVERTDFDQERAELLAQAPVLQAYAAALLKQSPQLMDQLTKASLNPAAGHVIVNFSTFLRCNRQYDHVSFAKLQYPIMLEFMRLTGGDRAFSEYNKYYREWAEDLEWFAKRPLPSILSE